MYRHILRVVLVLSAAVAVSDVAPAMAELVSVWRADGDATDANDGNHGSLSGSVSYAPGHSGQAFDFSGGHVQIPDAPNLDTTTAFTVAAWFLIDLWGPGSGSIYNRRTPSNIGGISLEQSGNGDLSCWVFTDQWRRVEVSGWGTGIWEHVTATYDGNILRVYKNGILANSDSVGFPIRSPDSPLVTIGKNIANGYQWVGKIDDVMIFNHTLSDSEIWDLYSGSPVVSDEVSSWSEVKSLFVE